MELFDQTGESQGDAWGHFTVMGRVRYWDGLIVLLQTPVGATSVLERACISYDFR